MRVVVVCSTGLTFLSTQDVEATDMFVFAQWLILIEMTLTRLYFQFWRTISCGFTAWGNIVERLRIRESNERQFNLRLEALSLKSFFLHRRYLLFSKPQTGCFHASTLKTDVAGGIFWNVSVFIPLFWMQTFRNIFFFFFLKLWNKSPLESSFEMFIFERSEVTVYQFATLRSVKRAMKIISLHPLSSVEDFSSTQCRLLYLYLHFTPSQSLHMNNNILSTRM